MAEGSFTGDAENLLKSPANLSSLTPIELGRRIPGRKKGTHRITVKDGTSCHRDRDAPGQNCTYVAPGDHRAEFYRLATYAKFPKHVPVKQTDMAAAGFYWTGFKDRVKCFSCGMTVENWSLGDDGMDTQWHKSTCRMASFQDHTNVPIPEPSFRSLFRKYRANPNVDIIFEAGNTKPMDISDEMGRIQINNEPLSINFANIVDPSHESMLRRADLRSEKERRKTFEKWPSYPAPYLVSDLAKNGFFYLGNLDRTQCFCCSGVLRNWAPGDDVMEQHKKHFGNCRIARRELTGNIPMSAVERSNLDREHRYKIESLTANHGEPPDPTPEEEIVLASRFKCRDPVNLHMVNIAARIRTFDNRWPKHRIRASIEQIAKAGFFFLGESDKTKCFYCNGGLQNWDRDDEPWTEHAKWFPGCEFVLRKKGIEFVRRLKDMHPNLNRPFIRNPASLDDVLPSQERRSSRQPSEEVRRPHQNIDRTQLESMGFSTDQIERAITRRGNSRFNTTDIVQDLLEQAEETPSLPRAPEPPMLHREMSFEGQPIPLPVANGTNKREGTLESNVAIKKTRTASPNQSSLGNEMAESLKEMEEVVLCKKCKTNRSEMTLLPCGHLCLCESCATNVKRCIICNGKVAEKIKVFRA